MTLLGTILFFLFSIALFKPYKYIVGLLMITCIFQASAAILINGKGVQPYLIGAFFLILKSIQLNKKIILQILKTRHLLPILFFIFYATISTLILPHIFEGITVFDKNLDESVISGGIKLKFGFGNLTQIGYLFVNCITLCCLWINRKRIQNKDLLLFFRLTVVIFIIIGFWEFISKSTNLITFPASLFYNNYGMEGELYAIPVEGVFRMNSTMTEASFCGSFLSASFWAWYTSLSSNDKKRTKYFTILILLAIMLNMSGTGVITFLFGGILYIWDNRLKLNFLFILKCLILVCLIFGLISVSGYGDSLYNMVAGKQESSSGIVRTLAVINSWNLFCDSYGLGVGLGSNRGGNLPLDLLSQIGLIGTVLFYYIFLRSIKQSGKGYIRTYLIVLMFSQCIAIPDFSFCCMWLGLYMAALCYSNNNTNKMNYKSNK